MKAFFFFSATRQQLVWLEINALWSIEMSFKDSLPVTFTPSQIRGHNNFQET